MKACFSLFLRRVLQMRRDFLTTCTQKSTQGKKLQADAALCGRSMVEMLGVLAIIGVLSVGAIAGYSKAMMKYKLNKQAEQIGSILDYATLYADQLHETNTWYGAELLTKLGAIPKEMIDTGNRGYIYDVFRNPVLIVFTGDSAGNRYHAMKISIGNHSYDVCLNLFQMAKLRSGLLWQTVFTRSTEDVSSETTNRAFGDAYCAGQTRCLKDLTLSQMHELCQTCDETIGCVFHFLWNFRNKSQNA